MGIALELPGLQLSYPDADQIARQVVLFRQSMQGLAGQIRLRHLALELDAVGTMLRHGFHPPKARSTWSIPPGRSVHSQGRTPISPLGGSKLHAELHVVI